MPVQPLLAKPSDALDGAGRPPGDKSISHRALMFGGLAIGETVVSGLLEGEDVHNTAAAMRKLGAQVEKRADGTWLARGRGVGGLLEPDDVLDMGNSGTSARLLIGLMATHELAAFVTGDASLRRRPMGRVIEPLSRMGAEFSARQGGRLPLLLRGAVLPVPIEYTLPVASAQVKSAILLAGLNAPGATTVIEPEATRDHTERMLRHFGAQVDVSIAGPGRRIVVRGHPELVGAPVSVPADPSSAAFPIVAALTVPGSRLRLEGVGVNPWRTGLYKTLQEMGAALVFEAAREEGGEPVADIVAAFSALRGVDVPAERAPSMIDEYPILAVAAAHATGTTMMRGLKELRVKESDRLAGIAEGLARCGVTAEAGEDWLKVEGKGRPPRGTMPDERIETRMDHRIAMSFLVLGLGSENGVAVDDGAFIDTSFPGFAAFMRGFGAKIEALA